MCEVLLFDIKVYTFWKFIQYMKNISVGILWNSIIRTHTLNTFIIVLTNHSNTVKLVFILLPDYQSYYIFLYPLWFFLNSWRIRKDPQIFPTQPKQLKFPIHDAKKSEIDPTQEKQRKQLILTNSKNILLNVFNQCNFLQPNFMTVS